MDGCLRSDTEPIEYLLEQGANPHIKDKFGLTAFDYAIRTQKNGQKC